MHALLSFLAASWPILVPIGIAVADYILGRLPAKYAVANSLLHLLENFLRALAKMPPATSFGTAAKQAAAQVVTGEIETK